MDDIIIKIENLSHSYAVEDEAGDGNAANARLALRDVSLELRRGEFVAILGRNGSGKSTLARHLNATLRPTAGKVYIDGIDTADDERLLEIRRRVGMVFQNPDNQIVANVVEEDVAFAPENLGVAPEEIRRRVDGALRMVGMYDYREHAPHLLSGGQKQRVAIAGVLAMEPECIVFDEPTAMLDPSGRDDVVAIIRALRDELGTTIVLITHHMEEAIGCDRVFLMSDGEIAGSGAPGVIFSDIARLRELGLEAPDTVSLLHELKNAGFDVPDDALSVDDAADAIFKALRA
jgi:energy-coupling factor transport system ATP-binding protein